MIDTFPQSWSDRQQAPNKQDQWDSQAKHRSAQKMPVPGRTFFDDREAPCQTDTFCSYLEIEQAVHD